MPAFFGRILQYSQAWNFYQWTLRRHAPEPGVVFLNQRRVYILPTRQGLGFGVVLLMMLIGSINYNLSLGYILTFLLAGLGVVSILHTFRNLAHLYVSAQRAEAVFAGDMAQFRLLIENRGEFDRHSIVLRCADSTTTCGAPARRTTVANVPLKAHRRGWLQLERVTLETRFPLGLMRAWSYVRPDVRALIYPRPDNAGLPAISAATDLGESVALGAGSDDYSGLRPYQVSDSPRHIAWKSAARNDALLTKTFSGRAAPELMFDWDTLPPDMGTEARLSRLARWVLLADREGLRYGLKLPGAELPLSHGVAQRERCLKALALYA